MTYDLTVEYLDGDWRVRCDALVVDCWALTLDLAFEAMAGEIEEAGGKAIWCECELCQTKRPKHVEGDGGQ